MNEIAKSKNCELPLFQIEQNVLRAYEKYYDVKKFQSAKPFFAAAEFHAHAEQFFLTRAAKVSDIDTNEYVFFARCENLSCELLLDFCCAAWQKGLQLTKPYFGHKNSDVSLVIFAERSDDASQKALQKIRRYKSHKFGIFGWSAFNAAFVDFSLQKIFSNSRGKNLKKNLERICRFAESSRNR